MRIVHGRESDAPSALPTETFTGTVYRDPVLSNNADVGIATVFFAPGARTYWHRHDQGQVLVVTHGRGRAQTRGGEGGVIGPGDIVYFEPGEEHWHGANPDTYLVHIAISLGGHAWLDEVDQQDYEASTSDSD